MSKRRVILALIILNITVLGLVQAQTLSDKVCDILNAIKTVLETIGGMIVIIMFVYGGLQYIFSADDPGGRKSGKNTCIHAIIGGIILAVAQGFIDMLGLTYC